MALNNTTSLAAILTNDTLMELANKATEAITSSVHEIMTDGSSTAEGLSYTAHNFSVVHVVPTGQSFGHSGRVPPQVLPGPVIPGGFPDVMPGEWQLVLGSSIWTALRVSHTLLTMAALLGNVISLIVMYGMVQRLTPPLQLLTSLAFADMLAPWAVMTLYFPASACQDEIHSALLLTAHNAAALTVLALSLCHHVATFRPLNYERILSQRRLWLVINVVWIAALLCSHVHFLAVLAHHDPNRPYCLQVLATTDMALTLALGIAAAAVLTAVVVYTRILLHLRPINQLAASAEPRKSTRGVVTGILLAATYVLTWTPYLTTKLIQVRTGGWTNFSILAALGVVQAAIIVRSVCDPIIYGVRMGVMQQGYLSLYHKCRGWAVSGWSRLANREGRDDLPSTPLNPIESIC